MLHFGEFRKRNITVCISFAYEMLSVSGVFSIVVVSQQELSITLPTSCMRGRTEKKKTKFNFLLRKDLPKKNSCFVVVVALPTCDFHVSPKDSYSQFNGLQRFVVMFTEVLQNHINILKRFSFFFFGFVTE